MRSIGTVLPRLTSEDLAGLVSLPRVPGIAKLEQIRRAGPVRLWDAACAALCVGPAAVDRSPPSVLARAAAIQTGRLAGFSWSDLSLALAIPVRSVHRLAALLVPKRVLDAVRVRLDLEDNAAERAAAGVASSTGLLGQPGRNDRMAVVSSRLLG